MKVRDSKIDTKTVSFHKNSLSKDGIAVKMDLNGNTLSSIKNDTSELVEGTDYTVSDNTVTISKSYLANQPIGKTKLTFEFSSGRDEVLRIKVKNN